MLVTLIAKTLATSGGENKNSQTVYAGQKNPRRRHCPDNTRPIASPTCDVTLGNLLSSVWFRKREHNHNLLSFNSATSQKESRISLEKGRGVSAVGREFIGQLRGESRLRVSLQGRNSSRSLQKYNKDSRLFQLLHFGSE